MIVFGAACFNFGVNLDKTGKIDAEKYAALLEKSLYESDYIERNSVVIKYDNALDFSLEIDVPVELLGNGDGFPLPPFFKLQFSIFIPRHVQENIGKETGFNFNILKPILITIIDTFHGPITLVQIESDCISDGSEAVILTREYLKKHFENKLVYFECIGPSPLHANFSITPADGHLQISGLDENGFSSTMIPSRGYDHIQFLYSASQYESDREALNELVDSLDNELGFFYLIHKLRVKKMCKWEEIDYLYKALVETTNKYDWFSRIKLTFSPDGKRTDQLLHKLTSFEIMAFEFTTRVENDYESIYIKGIPTYLQIIMDKEYRTKSENYPTKQIIYFLEFHEKRFLQVWQTSLLAVSALVGALIGSVITALTSSGN